VLLAFSSFSRYTLQTLKKFKTLFSVIMTVRWMGSSCKVTKFSVVSIEYLLIILRFTEVICLRLFRINNALPSSRFLDLMYRLMNNSVRIMRSDRSLKKQSEQHWFYHFSATKSINYFLMCPWTIGSTFSNRRLLYWLSKHQQGFALRRHRFDFQDIVELGPAWERKPLN
jgi:hypothetical protein